MCSFRTLTLLLASAIVLGTVCSAAKEKVWPNVACHPIHASDKRRLGHVENNKDMWKQCQDQEKEKGRCPKLCFLEWAHLVYRHLGEKDGAADPVIVDISSLVYFVEKANGYQDSGTQDDEKLLKRIEKGITACTQKRTVGGSPNTELNQLVVSDHQVSSAPAYCFIYKEITKLSMSGGCAQWDPFLSCLDAAYGCVGKEQ